MLFRSFQALAILHDLLALLGLRPEVGSVDQILGLGELRLAGGRVKDSSAQRQPAGGAKRTLFRVLLGSFRYKFSNGRKQPRSEFQQIPLLPYIHRACSAHLRDDTLGFVDVAAEEVCGLTRFDEITDGSAAAVQAFVDAVQGSVQGRGDRKSTRLNSSH